jgi:predicted nucleic acid-binding protein
VNLGQLVIAAAGLGQGELEAMALYKKLSADRLLVDDNRARRVARLNGIEIVGSVGVLLLAKERALLPSIRPRLEEIRAAGIHLGPEIFSAALRLAGEI